MLQNVIKVLSKRIEDYRKKNVNEASTKSGLIQPLFKEIGWDFTDIDSVEPEFSVLLEGENNPADYALKFEGKARLFLEAKRINEKIDIAIKDGAEKSIKENVPWLIATNGDDKLDQDVLNKIMEKIRIGEWDGPTNKETPVEEANSQKFQTRRKSFFNILVRTKRKNK